MGMPTDGFPPRPPGSAAFHDFSESLWRQRHERELWVKGRDEGSGLLCPWPHIAFVPLLSPEAGTLCSPCHSRLSFQMTASHLRHHLIYISNCHPPALELLINYLVTWLLFSACELIFHVKGPTIFFFFWSKPFFLEFHVAFTKKCHSLPSSALVLHWTMALLLGGHLG